LTADGQLQLASRMPAIWLWLTEKSRAVHRMLTVGRYGPPPALPVQRRRRQLPPPQVRVEEPEPIVDNPARLDGIAAVGVAEPRLTARHRAAPDPACHRYRRAHLRRPAQLLAGRTGPRGHRTPGHIQPRRGAGQGRPIPVSSSGQGVRWNRDPANPDLCTGTRPKRRRVGPARPELVIGERNRPGEDVSSRTACCSEEVWMQRWLEDRWGGRSPHELLTGLQRRSRLLVITRYIRSNRSTDEQLDYYP
jgi:hypothetical protein